MTRTDLGALLPHRAPYVFLTAIDLGPDGACVARATAPAHRALLIEVCAQAAAAMAGAERGGEAGDFEVLMVGVRRFHLGRDAVVGEALTIGVKRKAAMGGQALYDCTVEDAAGETIASGALALAVASRGHDHD